MITYGILGAIDDYLNIKGRFNKRNFSKIKNFWL